ncbi:serine hydrolase domain-containing protein [Saccharopolyspora cebuensis]|uniref:Serine hydrolase domain-containing protein n=1 Tax=Saccharopolyspora cebuensis TaxID=418759 RepID=A0ABV4CMZ1_9PSEU
MGRTMLVLAAVSVAALTGTSAAAGGGFEQGRFDRPAVAFADAELRGGLPTDVGLAPEPIAAAAERIARWTGSVPGREHPMYAGAVSLLAHDGVVVHRRAVGHALRYADGAGTELPPGQQVPMTPETRFDIASITKLFTSIAVLQQVEAGAVRLDDPVAAHLPAFAAGGKGDITVRHLLTHTSGLPATVRLWELPPERRIPAVLELAPERPPGDYTYSDPNMIVLGLLVERTSGTPLDRYVAERITGPLGMTATGYNPDPSLPIAATEFQSDPPRGMVRGEVHDENAWSLGGVAGHAGLFSTADDLAVLGQAILNGGEYGGRRVLSERGVRSMLDPGAAHGLGFELDQRWYMAGLSAPGTAGHTGYTGTSLVLDPASRSIAVLLTNRVHPSREWGSNNPARQELAQALARSLAVPPSKGSASWFADPARAATLTTDPLGPVAGPLRVSFDAFVDSQRDGDGTDPLVLEHSANGGPWRAAALRPDGPGAPGGEPTSLAGAGHRAWWRVHATVPARPGDQIRLRWRYAPDGRYVGRGVHVDRILAQDRDATRLDGEREHAALHPDGWTAVPR